MWQWDSMRLKQLNGVQQSLICTTVLLLWWRIKCHWWKITREKKSYTHDFKSKKVSVKNKYRLTHILSSRAHWLIRGSANCTAALVFQHIHRRQANSPHLALNASLAAAAVSGVAVQAAVAAALFPRQADGPELGLLPRVYAGDAGGSQQGPPALGGQRLEEEAVVHLDPVHVQVLVRHVLQRQQVGLSALHRAVPGQLRGTDGVEAWDNMRLIPWDWHFKNTLIGVLIIS